MGGTPAPAAPSTVTATATFLIGEDVRQLTQGCSWPDSNKATGTCAIPPNVMKPDGRHSPVGLVKQPVVSEPTLGGRHIAHTSGSVHLVSDGIALPVYRALATIHGGEVAAAP